MCFSQVLNSFNMYMGQQGLSELSLFEVAQINPWREFFFSGMVDVEHAIEIVRDREKWKKN